MADGYTVEDSGDRAEFDSGMVRDTTEGKLDYRIINYGPMKQRWIEHLNTARVKYPDVSPGIPNWTMAKGIKEFDRFLESAERHFDIWMDARIKELRDWSQTGTFTAMVTPEDEAAAVFFNINGAEFVRDLVRHRYTPAGVIAAMFAEATVPEPAEALDDLPFGDAGRPPEAKPGTAYH